MHQSGFLVSPEGIFGSALNPDLVTWDKLVEHPCLVLLGEPGIGKSETIRAWRTLIEDSPPVPGVVHHWINVSGYSEDRLRRRVLEADAIRQWLNGDHRLKLVLDSYDEAATPVLGSLFAEELAAWPLDRLSLAIACRTTEWPLSFEQELRRLWEKSGVGIYELVPLTYEDVELAARETLQYADSFLQEVSHLGLGALAAKPLTLNLLLDLFRRENQLPSSQADVYEAGFRLLASETNQRRRDAGNLGSCTPDERLAVAARIAAVMAFANRSSVWSSVEDGSVTERDVTVAALAGGTEAARSGTVTVTEEAIQETLASGLFSGRGAERAGFWHQTAEDHLAAWYVRNRGLDLDQIMALLVHPADPQGRIAPRLRAVAAWTAALVPGALPRIAAADAEVLIGSDVQITDPERRAELIETLLGMFEREELAFAVFGPWYRFNRFAHPGLAAQLRPWIRNRSADEGRVAALRVAAQCRVEELADDVLAVALDQSEPERVRVDAVSAAGVILDSARLGQLRPLVFGDAGDDLADRLKGYALQFLFPGHLTLEELLSAITPPRSSSGPYEDFLSRHLPEAIADDQLVALLRWLASDGQGLAGWFAISDMTDHLLRRAWDHIERDDVRDALAKVAWIRLRRDSALWRRSILSEDEVDPLDNVERRRRLLSGIVRQEGVEREPYHLLYGNTPVIRPEDVPWMAEQVVLDAPNAASWAWLVARMVNIEDPQHANAILVAAERSSEIRNRFGGVLGALELGSPTARKLKADHLRFERNRERNARRRSDSSTTPTGPEIQRLLTEAEAEAAHDREAPGPFWQLLHLLRFEPDGRAGASQLQLNVPEFPGWVAADRVTRGRILDVAKEFLCERVPPSVLLLDERTIHWVAAAGDMSMRLLRAEDPTWLQDLGPALWKRWIPSLLTMEILRGYSERELELLSLAQAANPRAFADEFVRATEAEIRTNGRAWGAEALADLLDTETVTRLASLLPAYRGQPGIYGDLLRPLLKRGSEEALATAIAAIALPLPPEGAAREVATISARALLAHAPEEGWPVLWTGIQEYEDFAVSVLASSVDSYGETRSITELASEQLADLYLWLARRTEAEPVDTYGDAPPSRLATLESRVLDILTGRASSDAIRALRRLAASLPFRRWLRRRIRQAEAQNLDQTWVAPEPAEVLALSGELHNRLVRTDEQLASVVLASLGRLQERLTGPNAPTFALWDRLPGDIWKPKEEERLSDFIADHLRHDLWSRGLMINREVEIWRRQGGASGEIPDLIVSASFPRAAGDSLGTVSVVIEVKGCWHRDVLSAMRTQLVERYMETSDSSAGIYCVGWYVCSQWDSSDSRRAHVPFETGNELKTELARQADQLSTDELRIHSFVLDASLR